MDQEIKEYLNKNAKLLPVNSSISGTEAERRAGLFLEVCAKIADWRHILSDSKIKESTVLSVTYSEELSKCTGKTVTENKVTVEANPNYTGVREDVESIDNDLAYLKAMAEVFNNGHLFYRNMAKENA